MNQLSAYVPNREGLDYYDILWYGVGTVRYSGSHTNIQGEEHEPWGFYDCENYDTHAKKDDPSAEKD